MSCDYGHCLAKCNCLSCPQIDDSDLLVFRSDYGKKIPKACKLSPDGWLQVSCKEADIDHVHPYLLLPDVSTASVLPYAW